jgi:hypothetical protein
MRKVSERVERSELARNSRQCPGITVRVGQQRMRRGTKMAARRIRAAGTRPCDPRLEPCNRFADKTKFISRFSVKPADGCTDAPRAKQALTMGFAMGMDVARLLCLTPSNA